MDLAHTESGLIEQFYAKLSHDKKIPNWATGKFPTFFALRVGVERHWAHRPSVNEGSLTPADVYKDGLAVVIPKLRKWARAAKRKLEQAALERKVS